jgi:hypothetical protein
MGHPPIDRDAAQADPPARAVSAGRAAAGVTVVVLTHNEAANIADCLRSCAWCDDVHVLDSGSTDGTADAARALGATVHVHPFESFGRQRNWAIDHVPHRHDWVFHLDADERFTPALADELRRVVAAGPAEAGFYVPSKLMFMGRWLRRSGGYPVYQMRFFHRGRMRFKDTGHGQREDTAGTIGTLREPYLHYNFSKGIADWIEKHNRYSTQEAELMVARAAAAAVVDANGSTSTASGGTARLFGSRVERRRFLKDRLWPRLPGRWLVRFLWMYVVKCGFLDGLPGFHYCLLVSSYDLWITLKVRERARHV